MVRNLAEVRPHLRLWKQNLLFLEVSYQSGFLAQDVKDRKIRAAKDHGKKFRDSPAASFNGIIHFFLELPWKYKHPETASKVSNSSFNPQSKNDKTKLVNVIVLFSFRTNFEAFFGTRSRSWSYFETSLCAEQKSYENHVDPKHI